MVAQMKAPDDCIFVWPMEIQECSCELDCLWLPMRIL